MDDLSFLGTVDGGSNRTISANHMYGQFTMYLPSETTSYHITVDAKDIGARFCSGW